MYGFWELHVRHGILYTVHNKFYQVLLLICPQHNTYIHILCYFYSYPFRIKCLYIFYTIFTTAQKKAAANKGCN